MTIDTATVISLAFNAVLIIFYQLERRRAAAQEERLIKAKLAYNLHDYYMTDTKAQIKQMNAEMGLAKEAQKLEALQDDGERGLPVG